MIKLIINRGELRYCAIDPVPISELVNSRNFYEVLGVFVNNVPLNVEQSWFPESEKRAIIKPVPRGKLDTYSSA